MAAAGPAMVGDSRRRAAAEVEGFRDWDSALAAAMAQDWGRGRRRRSSPGTQKKREEEAGHPPE